MKKTDNKDFLWYGLYAFAGFGLELLLLMFENMLINEESLFSNCLHLALTSVLWDLMGFMLYKSSKQKLGYDVKNDARVEKKNFLLTLLLIIAISVIKYFVFNGIKPIMEFRNLGFVRFIFQYIYYLFEVILILLTIAFGQKFFETVCKNKGIPFGGLFLGFTWGLMHILTQDFATGIYALLVSVAYGIIYLLLNKNTTYSYLAILILFVL